MKKIINYLPFIFTLITGGIALYIYINRVDEIIISTLIQIICCAFLPLIIPLYNQFFHKNIPFLLNIIVASHTFLAIDLGTACSFYSLISYYDMILHGLFGLIGSIFIYTLIIYNNGEKMNKGFILLIIFLSVLGLGGLWEIFEYLCDLITGGDAQRVEESIALGKSPIADTMEDLMITCGGIVSFYLILFIDKFNKMRLTFYLLKEKKINDNLKKK